MMMIKTTMNNPQQQQQQQERASDQQQQPVVLHRRNPSETTRATFGGIIYIQSRFDDGFEQIGPRSTPCTQKQTTTRS
eukprot:3241930-Amphidinium_carterae.1